MKNNSKMSLNKKYLDDLELRSDRKVILKAWDILVANIAFGTKYVSAERKAELLKWHADILDMDAYAIKNVPDEVKYYLEAANA